MLAVVALSYEEEAEITQEVTITTLYTHTHLRSYRPRPFSIAGTQKRTGRPSRGLHLQFRSLQSQREKTHQAQTEKNRRTQRRTTIVVYTQKNEAEKTWRAWWSNNNGTEFVIVTGHRPTGGAKAGGVAETTIALGHAQSESKSTT